MDAHTTTVVRTVGHSNRPLEAFLHLLRAHQVTLVVDVRKMPGSRRNTQFNRDTLSNALHEAGIGYVHLPDLGGLRRRTPSSPNAGWKNASFQGYADYMLTPAFERSLDDLLKARAGTPHRIDVRRGRTVALPPFPDRRRPGGTSRRGGTYPQRFAHAGACSAALGQSARDPDHVSTSGIGAIRRQEEIVR